MNEIRPDVGASNFPPILIPINKTDFESNFKNILNEILDQNKKTLFLHSESFEGKDLKCLLVNNFPKIKQETVLQHDTYPNDANKEDLEQFLKDPEMKIGIFQSRFVTGMEGSNVILFYDSSDFRNTSLRCNMTRAVSHLCIIFQFKNNSSSTKFLNTKMNKKFIFCQNQFVKCGPIFRCLTCNNDQICTACSIGCHNEHQKKI